MTKELIERIAEAREHMLLHGEILPSLWTYQGFAINVGELFNAIEALQARVAELEDKYLVEKGTRRLAVGGRDALAAELAALHKQEPVGSVEVFPFSNPGLRTVRFTEHGHLPVGVRHVFAAPTPPVREPLSEDKVTELANGFHLRPRDLVRAVEAAIKEQK